MKQTHSPLSREEAALLVVSMLIVSACSIVYELLISALSSYFLGSSVLHFSLTIGLFLFFMGVGSFLSRYLRRDLLTRYVQAEILIGVFGGLSGVILFAAYSVTEHYYLIALSLIAVISALIGLEIPLLTRMLESSRGLRHSLADVLSFDYMGALIASLLFPLVLLPYLGLQKTAFVIGLVNCGVAMVLVMGLRRRLPDYRALAGFTMAAAVALLLGLAFSFRITGFFEQYLYQDEIVHTEQSPYQRIVLTQHGKDLRLFLNGSLQFSSSDEYRYHEPLVHLPMSAAFRRERILLLGGGDGLAVRELLRYPEVNSITVVDLDPAMTRLGSQHAMLRKLNEDALRDPRVELVNQDAFEFVEQTHDIYDVVIIDLPDPSLLDLGKLYSASFYQMLSRRMAADGVVVTQASSPYFARKAFWCIGATLGEAFEHVLPYHSYVPSFGLWGYQMASGRPLRVLRQPLPGALRFLSAEQLPSLLQFSPDISPVPVEINRLENQVLVRYYEASW